MVLEAMVRPYHKPLSPAEAIHIVHGLWSPADAHEVIVLYDSLTLGPCHTDPEVHAAGRREYWLSIEQAMTCLSNRERRNGKNASRNELTLEILTFKQLTAALSAFPDSLPIVLWTSPNPGDRVAYWWVLDALHRGAIARSRCWVADSRSPETEPSALESYRSHTLEMIEEAFAGIRPVTRTQAREGASLWTKYASPSPAALDQLRRSGTLEAVDAHVISELLFWGLPRAVDREDSCLKLSEFDQLLLGHLDTRNWIRPYDVLLSIVNEPRTRRTLLCFGDRLFSQRFSAWACNQNQSDEPSLVAQPLPDGANALTNIAYRLTPKGERIVDVGLDKPEEAPEFYVGGCRVYRGTPEWARHIAGDEWRVSPWTRTVDDTDPSRPSFVRWAPGPIPEP